MPERSIGLAWKACVGLNQPWVRIPPCPTLLRPERSAVVLRRVGGQGIHSAGRENWLGLRVTGDQSHFVRPYLRTEVFTHAKVAKIAKGDEGIQDSGVKGGTNPTLSDLIEDRDIYSRKGR